MDDTSDVRFLLNQIIRDFVVLVVLSGGEITGLFMLSHLQICINKYSPTPAVGT
jgi:hypothetical protein